MIATFADQLRSFCATYQVTNRYQAELLELNSVVSANRPADFFEPMTFISSDPKWRAELLAVDAENLASWTRHIAGATWSRMRALEPPILGCFAENNILVGMILLRSHVEAAAMAAYCLEQLTDSGHADDFGRLSRLIAQTLFGTSMVKYRDHEIADRLTSLGDTQTIRVTDAIAALDKYFYGEHSEGQLGIAYSILCEFSHPNHGGTRHFMTAVDQPGGWSISYGEQERLSDAAVEQVFGTLIVSMRAGYSAGELLRCWRFSTQDERLSASGPSPQDADRVWCTFLQRPLA